MSIYPVAAATPNANDSTGGSSAASSTATDYTSMFMQLLATELQSQDPTQTMDPTTMVTQMVQINQLNDVAGIYSILQGSGTSSTSSTSDVSKTAGGAADNLTSAPPTSAPATSPSSAVTSSPSQPAQNTLGGS
jgi:flagellar hook assembly protein FlgD